MYRGEVCPFRNSRDSPLPLVPKGFPSVPPGLGSYFLCSYLGRDRRGSRTGRQKQTHRQRQAGQADGAEREPHLQEPASSTSVWDTDAREAERRVAGAAEGRGQRERVTSSPPSAGTASRHSSNLPTQPSRGRPSFHPSPQAHRSLRWGHAIGRGHGRCPLGSFLLCLLLQPPDGLGSRERSVLQSLGDPGPHQPTLAQAPPTVSTQKRSLCSKLARAKGPGSVFVHSKAKATMRASMTARWAPCGGKSCRVRPERLPGRRKRKNLEVGGARSGRGLGGSPSFEVTN